MCLVGEMSSVGLDHVKHFERKFAQLTAAVLQVRQAGFQGFHLCTLAPAYERKDAKETAHCKRVLLVTELQKFDVKKYAAVCSL